MYKNAKYLELASECYKNTNFLNLINKNIMNNINIIKIILYNFI